MIVLGIDPGKRQTWYSSLAHQRKKGRGQYVSTWTIRETSHLDLEADRPLNDRLDNTLDLLTNLVTRLQPDLVIAERYIVRPGRGLGNNAEVINIALGLLFSTSRQLNKTCRFVMPATWKQWWDKTFARSWYEHWPHLNRHQADACALTIYGHRRFTL